jgi:hypothetical protein
MAESQAQKPPWAWAELHEVQLGDARLLQRLIALATTLAENPEESLPQACGTWAATKAAYRFLDNDQVEFAAVLAGHRQATLRRLMDRDLVLVVQDTTTMDFTKHHATQGLGRTGAPGLAGFFVHSALCISAEGLPLGLLGMQPYVRKPSEPGKRRAARPVAEKESGRWLDMLRTSTAGLPARLTALTVADREADIFEFLALAHQLGQPVLVRASHDRSVIADGETESLWQAADASEVLGVVSALIPREHDRPARSAQLVLQASEIVFTPPRDLAHHHLPSVPVRLIVARELQPPEGEDPVHWLLLTTLPVSTLDQAHQCLIWYTYRWRIERFHHVLKSGCGYEKLQLETADRLWRALAVYAVVAWRVLYVDLVARAHPTEPCTTFLTADEWRALWCHHYQTPEPAARPPDAYTAVRWIAMLGGFLARRHDGEPGLKTLWRGLRRLQDLTQMWRIMRRE